MLKPCYSLKLLGAWQSYWTVMAAKDMQLLGFETKNIYDDLNIRWLWVSGPWSLKSSMAIRREWNKIILQSFRLSRGRPSKKISLPPAIVTHVGQAGNCLFLTLQLMLYTRHRRTSSEYALPFLLPFLSVSMISKVNLMLTFCF